MRSGNRRGMCTVTFDYLLTAAMVFLLFIGVQLVMADAKSATGKSECTVLKTLIVLVQFPDVERKVEAGFAKRRFFRELNHYVREMSYGKFCIGGELTERWYTLPQSISKYRIAAQNLNVDKSRVQKLVRDIIETADPDVDFSHYDFVTFFLAVERNKYGMIGMCAFPGMLGWTDTGILKAKSGDTINRGIALFTYQAHLGTLFHDIAHVLGGVKNGRRVLPCLYDHDLQSQPSRPDPRSIRKTFLDAIIYMGYWDPMSCHFIKYREPPPGVSSWTKLRLGWIEPSKIKVVKPGEREQITLGPLEKGDSATLVIKIPLTDTTYYLIENRQPLGFDRNLPASGILIMYADDSVAECRHGRGPVHLINADPEVPYLQGAAFDFDKNESFIDADNGVRVELLKRHGRSYELLVEHR